MRRRAAPLSAGPCERQTGAVRSGAEIRPHSFVTGFERDGAGRITAVLYQDANDEANPVPRRQKAKHVFLCAGAVETPRLLLHTKVGNANGQVGKHYMGHVATQVWGTFDEPVRMNTQPSRKLLQWSTGAWNCFWRNGRLMSRPSSSPKRKRPSEPVSSPTASRGFFF